MEKRVSLDKSLKTHGIKWKRTIGSGTYAEVCEVERNRERLAIKIFFGQEYENKTDAIREARQEVKILKKLREAHKDKNSQYAPCFHFEIFDHRHDCYYLAMDCIDGTVFPKHNLENPVFMSRDFFLEGMKALAWLHAAGVTHGDLNRGNVLVVNSGRGSVPRIKFIDFGFSLCPAETWADWRLGTYIYSSLDAIEMKIRLDREAKDYDSSSIFETVAFPKEPEEFREIIFKNDVWGLTLLFAQIRAKLPWKGVTKLEDMNKAFEKIDVVQSYLAECFAVQPHLTLGLSLYSSDRPTASKYVDILKNMK